MSGNYCVASAGQYKARLGVTPLFEINLPDPCPDPPTGSIIIGGEETALTWQGAAPVAVSSLSDGRRRLALANYPPEAFAGRHGAASLVTASIAWPCNVIAYDSTSKAAILAEPLPFELPEGETAYLVFRYVFCELPVRSEPVRECLLHINYTPYPSAQRSQGGLTFLVAYVRQIFSTGVTETDLRAYYYTLSSQPAQDAGFALALQGGEDELVTELRAQLMNRGLCEDDVPAAASLRQAHLLYSAACMFRISDPDTFDRLIAQAKRATQIELRRIWVDDDNNGKPNESRPLANRASDCTLITSCRGRGRRWRM